MKKVVIILFGIILLLILAGCSKITDQLSIIKNKSVKTNITNLENCQGQECIDYCKQNQEECHSFCEKNKEKCPEEIIEVLEEGPEGCHGEECGEYCKQNPELCKQWCLENPQKCPDEHFKQEGLSISFPEGITGPGGCTNVLCIMQICQQDPEECTKFCNENPKICESTRTKIVTEIANPPNTTIKYAKSVNIFEERQLSETVISRAKELEANMITIWPNRKVNNDEFIFFPEGISNMVDIAHKNGLQVELRSSYGILEEAKNYEKFRKNALEHVTKYAKFAEQHKVYRIVPFGEIDNHILNYPDKIEELSQELLIEMRKHYSGKIGIGVAAPWRDSGFKFKGYDYLTISAYPHKDLATSINWGRKVADRSNIAILHIGETGVINPEDYGGGQNFQTTVMSKEKEAEYYNKFFEEFSGKVNGTSVFFSPFISFMSIYNDPAEQVVKEWYIKIPNS